MAWIVQKASGEKESFNIEKFKHSLQRAGVPQELIQKVADQILLEKPQSTELIHQITSTILTQANRPLAARYNLKRAIMELGPMGYPFEKFVAYIFKEEQYTVATNQTVQGQCVAHEVDIVALQGDRHLIIECKFHNRPGLTSDVKVPLYTQARFQDIMATQTQKSDPHKNHEAWLVTNTRFTSMAHDYGKCMHMHLLSWNYPEDNSLPHRLERYHLVPVSALTSLNQAQKNYLIKHGCILCRDIPKHMQLLYDLHLNKDKINQDIEEAQAVCTLTV